MMPYTRKEYAGAAADTTLSTGINNADTTITVAAAAGWPTGAAGPFAIVIDAGTASEEKVLIASRTTTTLTVASSGRGYDSTTATSHSSGATVKHCLTAVDFDEANYWVTELAAAATAANDLIIADANDSLSRIAKGANSRVLAVDSGGVLGYTTVSSAMITDGTIATGDIADSAITSAKIADGTIVAGDIADGAVTSAKILDGTIATGDIADSAITSAKIADGTIATADIADSAITSAKIADGTIATADIADSAITSAKIAANAVTQAKVASGYRFTFTGTSAPSSPSEGDLWYDTTNDDLLAYHGTQWRKPWTMPWGVQGYAERTSTQSLLAGMNDLTSLSVTYTAIANRRIRITAHAHVNPATNDQTGYLAIRESSTTLNLNQQWLNSSLIAETMIVQVVITPTAGSKTYKASFNFNGAATGTLQAASTTPAFILVEDIGPNGNPA